MTDVEQLQELAKRFNAVYIGRQDYHGKHDGLMPPDAKGKRAMKHANYPDGPATDEDWYNHFTGTRYLGLSLLLENGTVRVGIIEVDRYDEGIVQSYADKVCNLGIHCLVTRSKSGGPHLEFIFSEEIQYELWENLAIAVERQLGLPIEGDKKTEHYPFKPSGADKHVRWINMAYADGRDTKMAAYIVLRPGEEGYWCSMEEAIERLEQGAMSLTEVKGTISSINQKLQDAGHVSSGETKKKKAAEPETTQPSRSFGLQRLNFRCEEVRTATSMRNNVLNEAAYECGALEAGGSLEMGESYPFLLQAAQEAVDPLPTDEILFTLGRSISQGHEHAIYPFPKKNRATSLNSILTSLVQLGVMARFDKFAGKIIIEGCPVDKTLTDNVVAWIRRTVNDEHDYLPSREILELALQTEAQRNEFNPVLDYFDGLKWDGVPRLSSWLSTYGYADDTELNAAFGRKWFIAGVRRVRQPGVKFDQMLVLESPMQGTLKSTVLATIAKRPEWFTDNVSLSFTVDRLIEAIRGKLIVEFSELRGMRDKDVEHVKNMLSRQSDSWRMAYNHFTTEVMRQCIFAGTTNESNYLRDPSGNRRFWTVRVQEFDIEGLAAAVDQLWAEASYCESQGETLTLARNLWAEAGVQQQRRLVIEPWMDVLDQYLHDLWGKVRENDLWRVLHIPDSAKEERNHKRIADAMRRLGWQGREKIRFAGPQEGAWVKAPPSHKEALTKILKEGLPRLALMAERRDIRGNLLEDSTVQEAVISYRFVIDDRDVSLVQTWAQEDLDLDHDA